MYQARIARYESLVNAYIYLNPNALAEARAIDDERRRGHKTNPLFGIPVLLKDNIDTSDMPTTAGSPSFFDGTRSIPPNDAFITARLREAGAIILGKATLTEFANFMSTNNVSGYSALGGHGFNPYDPRPDPRDGRAVQRRPARADARRVELGIGNRGRRESRHRRHRHRDVRIDSEPGNGEHGRRHQADARPRQPHGHSADHGRPGHRRSAGAHRGGCGRAARRRRRLRSGRWATAPCLQPGKCFSDYTQFLDKHALQRRTDRRAARAVPDEPHGGPVEGHHRRDCGDARARAHSSPIRTRFPTRRTSRRSASAPRSRRRRTARRC